MEEARLPIIKMRYFILGFKINWMYWKATGIDSFDEVKYIWKSDNILSIWRERSLVPSKDYIFDFVSS